MPKIYKPRASIFEKLHNFIPLNKETVVYLDLSNGGFFIETRIDLLIFITLVLRNTFLQYTFKIFKLSMSQLFG